MAQQSFAMVLTKQSNTDKSTKDQPAAKRNELVTSSNNPPITTPKKQPAAQNATANKSGNSHSTVTAAALKHMTTINCKDKNDNNF